ncbi:hypothetical protein [Streptomyces sp. NPDC058613]|uniref:hypothetical protein n=1 Tax=unclassified Streptomyces TaxID=2593676 RepID=UPI003660DDB8
MPSPPVPEHPSACRSSALHKILVSETSTVELDNHSVIPSALHREGHEVHIGDIGPLNVHESVVVADRVRLTEEFTAEGRRPRRASAHSIPVAELGQWHETAAERARTRCGRHAAPPPHASEAASQPIMERAGRTVFLVG